MHDNTQSVAYDRHGSRYTGYLHLIEQYQRDGAPFIGYLCSSGFCVARTDRHQPEKVYRVSYRKRLSAYNWQNFQQKMPESQLEAMRHDPANYEVRRTEELPKEGWYRLPKSTVNLFTKWSRRSGGGRANSDSRTCSKL